MSDSFEQSKSSSLKLDLGLGSLLASAEDLDISEDLALLASKRLLSKEANGAGHLAPDKESSPPRIDPYELLAGRKAWAELLQLCEAKLEECEADLPARLWWIRAQLALGQMPVSILAAPLEPVAEKVLQMRAREQPGSDGDAAFDLAELVLSEVAHALEKSGELEISLAFWEKAFRLNAHHQARLLEVVNAGLAKCNGQRVGARPNGDLRFKEKLLGLRKELSAECIEVPKNESSARLAQVKNDSGKSPARANRTVSVFLTGAAALALTLGLQAFWPGLFQGASLRTRMAPAIKESAVYSAPNPELRAPVVSRSGSPNLQSLMGILYALDNAERVGAPAAEVPAGTPLPASKIRIDTSSPLEPREVSLIFENGPEQQPEPSTWRVRPYREPIVRGQSRNDPIVAGDLIPGGRAPQVAQSERVFIVIVPSLVLAQPSSGSFEVGRLEAGDQVRVIESMGRWLKVLSRAGREGYVLAENARLR